MKKLFENAITNIEELIKLRSKQLLLLTQLERSKEASSISFKLKYYKIWINLLKDCIKKNIEIKDKNDINTLKLTKSLGQNLVELFETGEIKDVEDTKTEIQNLEKQLKKTETDSASLYNSMNSTIEDNENEDNIEKAVAIKPIIEKTKKTKQNEKLLDTSKIESQPKILAEEIRPTDARGGAIFDMRYIYGIGPKNAEKLVDNGITLEKLLEEWTKWISKDNTNAILMISKISIPLEYTKKQWEQLTDDKKRSIQIEILNNKLNNETKYLCKLNSHQLLGVKYFHDMSQKIPREEVQKGERILKAAAKHMNKDIILTLCGSYRRGRSKSGDIDCLITHTEIKTLEDLETNPVNILAKFVELLTNLDFLVDHLTDFGRSKYMGFCIIKQNGKKNNIARRIDIRFIPFDSYGTSILYFTGSKTFNTKMRTHALSKGYSLNEYGLKRMSDNVLIPCKTEEEVFEILKYPYKKPEERDI
jgi:DNA polymerase/3'-5' exonuclease PolX/predicted flap endonuclease-1-like 5' DNA nuclease